MKVKEEKQRFAFGAWPSAGMLWAESWPLRADRFI
jgi:hypothetical protein